MRFTLMLGIGGYADYRSIAIAAEAAGCSSISMPDSLFYPKHTDSAYPYADTDEIRKYIENAPFIEPFIAMAVMAAVTTRIRFYPSVLKVPVRQPLVLAKALSSLGAVAPGRISLGAGLSPWREEFEYNGVPFEQRGQRMDECLAILRQALTGEYFEHHGDFYRMGPLKISPVPANPIKLLIGGHSKAALRRAARLGDGWISANTDFDTLKTLIGELVHYQTEQAPVQGDFEIHGFDMHAKTLDDFRRLEDIGVTDICTTPWNVYQADLDSQSKIDGIRQFADTIIHRYPCGRVK